MNKNFDQEREAAVAKRDLEFTAGGQVFHVIPFVHPEKIDAFQPTKRKEGQDILEVYDEWIVSMLVDEDKPNWAKVRKEATPPLELHTIEAIVFWLIEVATGRPTERPSSSRPGQAQARAGSEGRSASQVQAA